MDQAPIDPAPAASAPALTPMMAQYWEIKAVNPGFLLFYRMGDFYELFFEDAEIASAALGIVLTKRGKHQGQDIPMCGVPIHAAQDYLRTLIRLGHRVAICEQVEDPAEAKKRGGKSVVKRDVVRLVTAGTITEDELLPARGSALLASLAALKHGDTDFALAWADISTGETGVLDVPAGAIGDELARLEPAELILTAATRAALNDARTILPEMAIAEVPVELFGSETGAEQIRAAFPDGSLAPTSLSRCARAAFGALIAYVAESQKGKAPALRPPRAEAGAQTLGIDAATRRSLELLTTQKGERKGSLLAEIDCCVTIAGSRLLARRLAAPLCQVEPIVGRLDAVGCLAESPVLADSIRHALRLAPDLTRALTRIALERAGPRDLHAIAGGVVAAGALAGTLGGAELPTVLAAGHSALAEAPLRLAEKLAAALVDEPPFMAADGGFIRTGYEPALDGERALATEARAVVAALQARLQAETEVKALKIRHNGVLGYFVEVPAAHGNRLLEPPHRDTFIHRQTLAGAMRFTTAELAGLEGRIARAHEAALEIEQKLFRQLCNEVLGEAERLREAADALAQLDVSASLAHLAATRNWCRPQVDSSTAFEVEAGRHPVVEATVAANGGSFVANDCDLSGNSEGGGLWLVTGPNMGGKSTFLRQNALIAILAQTGSFVPARRAHLGVVDRVFSRVGAADDIAHGRSTFMVEMVETASILNRATSRSLVILDEIGRGTATFDGLSIAWATAEALHETVGCRALFATHFHELTALGKTLPRVSNHTMAVREWNGDVVFLHEVAPGAADRSYGIQVARLAGLPEPVLRRARTILDLLEARNSGNPTALRRAAAVLEDLPLFAHQPPPPPARADPLGERIDALRPDELTPREAIELLYELKKVRDAARRS